MDALEVQSDRLAGSANNTYKNTMNWTETKSGGEYKTMLFYGRAAIRDNSAVFLAC